MPVVVGSSDVAAVAGPLDADTARITGFAATSSAPLDADSAKSPVAGVPLALSPIRFWPTKTFTSGYATSTLSSSYLELSMLNT